MFIGTGQFGSGGLDIVLLNQGGGVYTHAVGVLPTAVDGSAGVALMDFDGDGDLDALTANSYSEGDKLYRNDGAATFTDASAQLPAGSDLGQFEIVAEDFDLDGDPDVLGRYAYWTSAAGAFVDATAAMPWVRAWAAATRSWPATSTETATSTSSRVAGRRAQPK